MPRDKGLDTKMDAIANFVADRILSSEEIPKEVNDAFKTLTQYWTSATKLDKISDEDTENSSGFGGIKARIAAAGGENNGRTATLSVIKKED